MQALCVLWCWVSLASLPGASGEQLVWHMLIGQNRPWRQPRPRTTPPPHDSRIRLDAVSWEVWG